MSPSIPFGPEWLLPVLAAPFVGSFLGVVALRLPAGGSVVWGRSACPHCHQRLGPGDLIPFVSWLASRGRCRMCTRPLGFFYPAIEAAALLVAVWAAAVLSGWILWAGCVFGWTLLALAVIDAREMVLVDPLTLPLVPAGLAVAYAAAPADIGDHAAGAAIGFAAFAGVGWAYRRLRGRPGLGLGDAKLLAGAGAWVSWIGLPGVVLIAAASALAVVLARRCAGHPVGAGERLAFGPYLCLATWIVWLYGPVLIG